MYHSEGEFEYFKYIVVTTYGTSKVTNASRHEDIVAALKTGDTSSLDAVSLNNYNTIVDYLNGDRSGFGLYRVFGEDSSQSIIAKYRDGELNLIKDAFYGSPTETMTRRKSTLDKLELETFTNIILGASIDTFDTFVEDWKKLGGEQITKEVNEWYSNR